MKLKIFVFCLLTFLNIAPFLATPSAKIILASDYGPFSESADDINETFKSSAGFSETSITGYLKTIIYAFLGLLGIIFLIIILLGGYNWMTAGGDESKVKDAMNSIKRAVIGLLLIISAYSITYFVFTQLPYGKVK